MDQASLPTYWACAVEELSEGDARMAELIARYPGLSLRSRGDAFGTLARSIVGQQISVKAADAVWARFAATLPEVAPAVVLAAGQAGLSGCGLSRRKVEYLIDLASHFANGQIDPASWSQRTDEEIIGELCAVRGIGRWTAEMLLIFNLMRPDVFPVDDIGLQRAVFQHFLAGERLPPKALSRFGARWAPWRTVATWYLWRSLDPVPVEY